MQELEHANPVLSKPSAVAAEAKGLEALTALINTPDFNESNPGSTGIFAPESPASEAPAPARPVKPLASHQPQPLAEDGPTTPPDPLFTPQVAPQVAVPPRAKRTLESRVFTTGRLRVGKDFVLAKLGFQIAGFAEPLYALQETFFGTADKKAPGAREFLQTIGQWGRGHVDASYPLTPLRAVFTSLIRGLSAAGRLPDLGVDWKEWGHKDIWLNALLRRIQTAEGPTAVSNVRFKNEMEGLSGLGWTHYHVMCSPATWAKRLESAGMTPSSHQVSNPSEQMAIALDGEALQMVKLRPTGPKLRVIWNDITPAPSPRFIHINELF